MDADTDFASPEAIVAGALRLLIPPPRRTLSSWADEKYYLSSDAGAAEPGRWKTLPFQRGWMDALTDPRLWQVTVMKSARVGWTESMKAFVGYHVDYDPCPILLIQPTEDDAKGFSKESIEPLLRDVPDVGAKFARYALRNTLLLKRYRGGLLQLASARKPGDFRRVGRRIVLGDEVDGYPMSAGKEGDPTKLAAKRSEYYWNRKLAWGSTPTITGASRIERLFFEGDQRRYYVPCPHCGCMQVLKFSQFSWPPETPEDAVYVCHACGCAIEHAHKRDMVAAGEWRPGPHQQFPDDPPPTPFDGHASFHIWAAYSFSPNASWGQLCKEFVAAKRAGAEQLQTFVNTNLGETWQVVGEAPDWQRLYERRESYAVGTVPKGALFLTAAADVQHDRILVEVVGWGRGKTSWSIDWFMLPGETADVDKGPWLELAQLLERTFTHETGREMHISVLAVDSGDQTQTVYSWTRRYPLTRVIAVKGFGHGSVLLGAPTTVDVNYRGKRIPSGAKVWPVAVNLAKSELYGWLRLHAPTDEEREAGAEDPAGYCHFPQHPEEYFKELTSEQLVKVKNRRGYTDVIWEVIPGRQNHTLDARGYARAAAQHAGLDRFRDHDWQRLEERLGLEPTPRKTPSNEAPPSTPPPTGSSPPRKPKWIRPRRPGGWLRGGR
jgi:phage terminase large subunit GpA-like protein